MCIYRIILCSQVNVDDPGSLVLAGDGECVLHDTIGLAVCL